MKPAACFTLFTPLEAHDTALKEAVCALLLQKKKKTRLWRGCNRNHVLCAAVSAPCGAISTASETVGRQGGAGGEESAQGLKHVG